MCDKSILYGFILKNFIFILRLYLEKLNYFVRHYYENFYSLIGGQTARISWQEYFLSFVSATTLSR